MDRQRRKKKGIFGVIRNDHFSRSIQLHLSVALTFSWSKRLSNHFIITFWARLFVTHRTLLPFNNISSTPLQVLHIILTRLIFNLTRLLALRECHCFLFIFLHFLVLVTWLPLRRSLSNQVLAGLHADFFRLSFCDTMIRICRTDMPSFRLI